MMNLLFISNISGKKFSLSFCGASVNACKEMGFNWISAMNRSNSTPEQISMDEKEYGVKHYHIDLARSPYSFQNIKAYKQLCKIIKDEKIDIIHCNTPVGGILGRLAGAKCGVKKVIYQAHGFHFYKGAPKKNWLIYYPIEKWLAHKTDAIITINKEDYELASKKFHLRGCGKVYYVPGVGIDTTQYKNEKTARIEKRNELGLKDDDIALISMGDLIERKNYPMAIKGLSQLNNLKVHYYICGKGPDEEKLKLLVSSLDLSNQVHFLGFRTDIKELLNAADIFVLTSKQEGLARSLMEGMAAGLPCVASRIRGNTDILDDGRGGFLVENENEVSEAIRKLQDVETRQKMSIHNLEKITGYSIEGISEEIKNVYTTEINGGGVQPN